MRERGEEIEITHHGRVAGRLRVRGADAIHIAAAVALRVPVVTWDVEQRDRATSLVEVLAPEGGE